MLLSNPKMLMFFGAFIPQFVDLKRAAFPQVALFGATFMVIAGITDAMYAMRPGGPESSCRQRRTRMMSRIPAAA